MNNLKSKKIKVLHLITRLAVGGAQDNTLITVKKLDRDLFDVHVASNPNGEWLDWAQEVSDQFHPIPHLVREISPINDISAFWEITALLKREKFDIIHTHSTKAGLLGRWAAKYVGDSVIIHTIHGFPFHDQMPRWQKQMYISLEKSVRTCSDYITTLSDVDRQEALKYGLLDWNASQTIYTGIDLDKLTQKYDRDIIRQNLGLSPSCPVIVMVGRLDPQKAPYLLISAFVKVVAKHPEAVLLLVGDGELRSQLETQVKNEKLENNVKFLGACKNVPEILQSSDIFCFTSLWEAMGRSMIEAAITGLPVVVPRLGGIPEVITHKECGLIFEPGNIDQVAEYLLYLIENPNEAHRLGKNAQIKISRLFDANEMVKQFEAIYQTLLKTKELF
ncbi:glycosyltransferase family 4 protein [Cyanobacterium sp. Dongsha4]|uniref:glycosyltransferase family 4 protein n=1 Tax=Cyanobacterium sp. DS4 TaxID=2878255 RepID=UPI002E818973|nr:glycosyltransferase family 4 protein [Cyanobacterium sp. Dongsha4]WVK99930.1 glycosyltransferase family 4 protein [Cyanobacterium sp. Dongsha4]